MEYILVLENIRSAYNVGNLIRTADGLGRKVLISGYTAHPVEQEKVKKTSLGAEVVVLPQHFREPSDAIRYVREYGYVVVAGEKTSNSVPLEELADMFAEKELSHGVALILGNEKTGVLEETIAAVDMSVHIPMQGLKASFNVGQAGAILMREINRIMS